MRILCLMACISTPFATVASGPYVVHISVDGLRPDAITVLGPKVLPNFYRLRREGAYTDNARTDADETITLPNHTSMITGRPVSGEAGHHYTANGVPVDDVTLRTVRGHYVSSVFDVVHDHGGSTGLYASKEKFILYERSYDAINGAPDQIGDDDGRDKIDHYLYLPDSQELVARYISALRESPYNYSLLHLHDPDTAGHAMHWDMSPGSAYLAAVVLVDELLGQLLAAIDDDTRLARHTTVVLSADHGGRLGTIRHEPYDEPQNYTIPFYVWGSGVPAGDLYALHAPHRVYPGLRNPGNDEVSAPVRAADGANLALRLLGLPPVPGSSINARQDLLPGPPAPVSAALAPSAGARAHR